MRVFSQLGLISFVFVVTVNCDVSHLRTISFGRQTSPLGPFSGYHYDPPTTSTTPITLLPEIVINRDASAAYLPPSSSKTPIVIRPPDDYDMHVYLPPLNDETPSQPTEPPSEYLPPNMVPSNDYIPPASDVGYNYPKPHNKHSKLLNNTPHHTKSNALQVRIDNMRCLDGNDGHFQAVLSVESFIENLPIIDIDTIDQHCKLHLTGIKFYINIGATSFRRCNVYACGQKELCLQLRFPQIFGMKSLEDGLLTLQCKLQERVVTKTHTLRMGIANVNQAKNAIVYAQMGRQQLRSHIGLYRHQALGGLTRNLSPGSAVQLGEELVLRAQIKSGDGWNHSRLSDVTLQRVGGNGDVLNSATLVKSDGCINPKMQAICSIPPVFEAPLGYRLGFRAVMFQGMKSGDEMQVNVRIVGCVNPQDCNVELRSCNDVDDRSVTHSPRTKRNSINHQPNVNADLYEVSNISFRVMLPNEFDESRLYEHRRMLTHINGKVAAFTTIIFVILLISSALVFVRLKSKRFYFVWDKY